MASTEIQPLYRSFLKVVQKWPADKVRPTRDLKQVLTTRVEETFRKPLANEATLDFAKAERELFALEKLLNNEFKEKVNNEMSCSIYFLIHTLMFSTLCLTRSCHLQVTPITTLAWSTLLKIKKTVVKDS